MFLDFHDAESLNQNIPTMAKINQVCPKTMRTFINFNAVRIVLYYIFHFFQLKDCSFTNDLTPLHTVQHEGGKMQEEAKERKEEDRPPTCCQHFTPNFRQENNKPKTPPPDCMREGEGIYNGLISF